MIPFHFPATAQGWGLYLLSLLFAFLINTQVNLLTGLLTFFMFRNDGMIRAKRVIVDLMSGLVLPISFFPGWAQTLMGFLPFQAINYYPSLIFTGATSAARAWQLIGFQVIWMAVILIPILILWRMARSRLVVQGG